MYGSSVATSCCAVHFLPVNGRVSDLFHPPPAIQRHETRKSCILSKCINSIAQFVGR